MLDRARDAGTIGFITPYVVDRLEGEDNGLEIAHLRNVDTGEEKALEISGAFIAIGHKPNSKIVEGQVELDENGYVLTQGRSTLTNVSGVFAAGDLVDHTYRQAVTAAGSGCQAALDSEWYLRDTPFPVEDTASAAAQASA